MLKPRAGEKCDEILWRLARSTYNLGQSAESARQKEMYTEAFQYAKEALELNTENFACHKVGSVYYSAYFGGSKTRLFQTELFVFRD